MSNQSKFLPKGHKIVQYLTKILNRKPFINRDHPTLHPASSAYVKYWKAEKKKCIEGFWGEEAEGHWRYMTPLLYFYINHYQILDQDLKVKSRVRIKPSLDDIEWIFGYYFMACQGFSGFIDDDEYSCNLVLEKQEKAEKGLKDEFNRPITLDAVEEQTLNNDSNLRTKSGDLKKYKPAFEYLCEAKEANLGLPLYDNPVTNVFLLGPRSTGKSYLLISAHASHEFLFDGAKYYDSRDMPTYKTKAEIFLGSDSEPHLVDSFNKIKDGISNLYGSYSDRNFTSPPPFSKLTKGSWKNGGTVEHSYRKKVGNNWKYEGSGSFMKFGLFTTQSPDTAVGGRFTKIFVDEAALIKNLVEVHGANKQVIAPHGKQHGMAVYCATGGNVEKIDGAKKLFYSPKANQFLSFNDVWENKGQMCFFLPSYYALRDFKDENGNTNFDQAINKLVSMREIASLSEDPLQLIQEKMYLPLVPSEMFVSTNANILPSTEASKRINELESGGLYKSKVNIGEFYWKDKDKKSVGWKEFTGADRNKAITTLNLDTYNSLEGAVCIYEHPQDEEDFFSNKNPYKIVFDPYRVDEGGESLASVLVHKTVSKKGLQNTIVAEYIGRRNLIEDIYEIIVQLCTYYNCRVLDETNVNGFQKWVKLVAKRIDILQPTPWSAIEDSSKNVKRKQTFGVSMTSQLKPYCLTLAKRELLTVLEREADGTPIKFNIDNIFSLRLLEEIAFYTYEKNFDHVSSYLILVLWLYSENKDEYKELEKEEDTTNKDFEEFYSSIKNSFY